MCRCQEGSCSGEITNCSMDSFESPQALACSCALIPQYASSSVRMLCERPGDDIVDVRAASRSATGLASGNVSLSLSQGVVYDQNVAKRIMEQLRRSLRFEQAPVITDFDPRYNQNKTLWFEKLYEPFLGSNKAGLADD